MCVCDVCVCVCVNVFMLGCAVSCPFHIFAFFTGSSSQPQPGDTDPSTVKTIKENEDKKEFVREFKKAEMSTAETPQEKSVIRIKRQKLYSILFTMKGVGQLGKKAFILTCIVLIIAAAVGYYCSCVEQQEELQAANKCENILFSTY